MGTFTLTAETKPIIKAWDVERLDGFLDGWDEWELASEEGPTWTR